MDKKIAIVLILFLIVGVVAVSGCTSSDNTTTPANTTMSNASTTTENTAATTNASTTSTNTTYIGNSNTHKFHLASCRYVSKMSEDHKVYFNTRDEAIAQGYVPCKVCNP